MVLALAASLADAMHRGCAARSIARGERMDFSVTESHTDNIDFITHAETLGYTHCAATDSQMIRSNCFAVLALAAQQTHTIKLGTGSRRPDFGWPPVEPFSPWARATRPCA